MDGDKVEPKLLSSNVTVWNSVPLLRHSILPPTFIVAPGGENLQSGSASEEQDPSSAIRTVADVIGIIEEPHWKRAMVKFVEEQESNVVVSALYW